MKYGEALPQRSVQEWLPFNLDYNEICDLIKKHTIGRIPVSNPSLKSDFDDEIFEVLVEQLERIELFVKSKAGEIDRRISHCTKIVTALCQADLFNTLTARRLARFAKAESELERAGYDIQCLSRYSKVQYTGFKKLLKKYKKWTGSSCLSERFLPILDSPDAFHNRDFERNVLQLSELLAAVRSKYNEYVETQTNGLPPKANVDGISGHITFPPETNGLKSHADIDMALGANSPSNPLFASGRGGKTIYWVHNDHLVEVQVLLLKHLNMQPFSPSPTVPSTPALSRRTSYTGIGVSAMNSNPEKVEEVGSVLLDNLPNFAQAQSSKTIEEACHSCPAAKVRWCGSDKEAEATVVVGIRTSDSDSISNDLSKAEHYSLKLKRKYVENLLNLNTPFILRDQTEVADYIRNWLKDHPDIVPLVKILARRTRFAAGKVWAVLDRDIKMYHIGANWEGCISDPRREDTGRSATFPHAVLELRWEGAEVPALVNQLNHSHLVEVVHGFSLDVHAVAVLHEPKEMAPPFWLPALSRDIRKTPSRPMRLSRASTYVIPRASSSNPSIGSTLAVDQTDPGLDSSGTLVMPKDQLFDDDVPAASKKPLRWSQPNKLVRNNTDSTWLGGERYWSEFNEENDDEPYTILIPASSVEHESKGFFGNFGNKLKRLFSYQDDFSESVERRPLIAELGNESSDDEETRTGTWDDSYGAILQQQQQQQQQQVRERMLLRGYCLTFMTSITILAVTTAWVSTHSSKKHKPEFTTGLGETLGVFTSAVTAGYAVSLFVARKDRVSLLHKSIVLGLFCLICLMGSLVLCIVYNNWLRP